MRRSDERGAARVHVQLHAGQLPRDGVERADKPAVADGLRAEGRLLRVGGEEQQRGVEEAVERDLVFCAVCCSHGIAFFWKPNMADYSSAEFLFR